MIRRPFCGRSLAAFFAGQAVMLALCVTFFAGPRAHARDDDETPRALAAGEQLQVHRKNGAGGSVIVGFPSTASSDPFVGIYDADRQERVHVGMRAGHATVAVFGASGKSCIILSEAPSGAGSIAVRGEDGQLHGVALEK